MVHWFRHPLRSLTAIWHRLAGRICFQLGRTEPARRHFEHVLRLRGDDFIAYIYLGRLAYSARDYPTWRRELASAQRTAPERYAQLKFPFELFEPPATDRLFEEAGERATWRSYRATSVSGGVEAGTPDVLDRGLGSCPRKELRRFGDDFSSSQERERFAQLPPISRDELDLVDLDRLTGFF
ncbi:MAG: hypothetical protein H6837_12550 [Planctomycetes bacterium]|nr:hypothetical protein [Planctomycetota bacterium]